MNNIDNIFSKLKGTEKEAPDIWNKIELELNNPKNIFNNANQVTPKQGGIKALIDKALNLSTTVKTVGIITATSIVGVGTYLIIDNNLSDGTVKKEISLNTNDKIKSNTISNQNTETYNNINENQLVENYFQIENPKNKQEQNNDIVVEYNIKDDQSKELSNDNYKIEPIKNNINTSELIKNNKIAVTESQEDKILPVENDEELPDIPNLITPNGDGINDFFEIKNLDKFPDNSITIYDQRGKIVYRSKGYKNDFSAANLPVGTYFYKFVYNKLGKNIPKSGSITVMK